MHALANAYTHHKVINVGLAEALRELEKKAGIEYATPGDVGRQEEELKTVLREKLVEWLPRQIKSYADFKDHYEMEANIRLLDPYSKTTGFFVDWVVELLRKSLKDKATIASKITED